MISNPLQASLEIKGKTKLLHKNYSWKVELTHPNWAEQARFEGQQVESESFDLLPYESLKHV